MDKTIGMRIKELRIIRGMTQEELAEKMYTTRVQISKYERDIDELKVSKIKMLEEILDTTASYLVDGREIVATEDAMYGELIKVFAELINDKVKRIALEQMKLLNHM
jgi:transcriptional regulator with XRE-family HTH domain